MPPTHRVFKDEIGVGECCHLGQVDIVQHLALAPRVVCVRHRTGRAAGSGRQGLILDHRLVQVCVRVETAVLRVLVAQVLVAVIVVVGQVAAASSARGRGIRVMVQGAILCRIGDGRGRRGSEGGSGVLAEDRAARDIGCVLVLARTMSIRGRIHGDRGVAFLVHIWGVKSERAR